MSALLLPKTIGDYEILTTLASGGMGTVLLGEKVTAQGFRKRVAIKVILPHLLGDVGARELFFDEARLAARFSHPNLVQVYDFGEDAGFFHLVMELVEGASVMSIIERGPVEAAIAARVVVEAARGLAWAHGLKDESGAPLGVVHRDVSPDNLFVTAIGGTKVLDFGIARTRDRAAVSVVGLVRGKPAYMAPEHLLGELIDGRADVWSLGVIFFELLTGQRLFRGDGLALARRVIEEPLPAALMPLATLAPPALVAIALRMLSRDVVVRLTMAEVVAAFDHCADVAPPTAVLPALTSRMPSLRPVSSTAAGLSSAAAKVVPRGDNEATAPLLASRCTGDANGAADGAVDDAGPVASVAAPVTRAGAAPRRAAAVVFAVGLAASGILVASRSPAAAAVVDAGAAAPVVVEVTDFARTGDAGATDARDLLLASDHVNSDGSASDSVFNVAGFGGDLGQPLDVDHRAGMITTAWFMAINTMFSQVPRTTAAQATALTSARTSPCQKGCDQSLANRSTLMPKGWRSRYARAATRPLIHSAMASRTTPASLAPTPARFSAASSATSSSIPVPGQCCWTSTSTKIQRWRREKTVCAAGPMSLPTPTSSPAR